MPSTTDIPLPLDQEGEDLYPFDEEAQQLVVNWVTAAFDAAELPKQTYMTNWLKYYQMYRSFPGTRKKGDWKSRVWMPISFYVIETITPRLVAQLPKFSVYPVGPEDSLGAEQMEKLLAWATDQSDMYLELVKAFKSSLMYGTGIVKTMYEERIKYRMLQVPVMEPVTMSVPTGEIDLDGNPIEEQMEVGQQPTGEIQRIRQPFVAYQGPRAEAVDIANFFPAPEATSIEDARYVIHRVFRSRKHIEQMAASGVYKLPPDTEWNDFLQAYDYPAAERLSSVNLGTGTMPDRNEQNLIEILEVWTDEVVVAIAGRSVLLRAERNPFSHGEKPFVRIVDHLVPHEFWGIGELEPLEGIQDTLNALWNSRIDNVKMVLNAMFAVSDEYLVDKRDLVTRPGGVVRFKEGIPLNQAFQRIDLGETTNSAYTEAAEIERFSEKVSGVSAYQMGMDSPALNRTATGVALISEQGNTRFAHKTKIAELTGLRRLASHYGSILQQYMPPEMPMRLFGPEGQVYFEVTTPESIMGAFDYDVEAESSSQTESIRQEQNLSLFNLLIGLPEVNRIALIHDILETFGKKNAQDYMLDPMMAAYQQQLEMMTALGGQGPGLPQEEQAGGPQEEMAGQSAEAPPV